MNSTIYFERNQATVDEIASHLRECASSFLPPLNQRVDIANYSKKLFDRAVCFEARHNGTLVGLVAAYLNDSTFSVAFVTSVSVLVKSQGEGIAFSLMMQCLAYAFSLGFKRVELEVDRGSAPAIGLYSKLGFLPVAINGDVIQMYLCPANFSAASSGS